MGSIQEQQKVEKLIMKDFWRLHSGEYDKIVEMVIDGKEQMVCRPYSKRALSINDLMELNKKRTIGQLTYILVIVAALLFALNIVYDIWILTGND
jgi:hypothetical protein